MEKFSYGKHNQSHTIRKTMKDPKKKVITPKTWNKIERQKDKILDQAEEIQRQKERIAELMEKGWD